MSLFRSGSRRLALLFISLCALPGAVDAGTFYVDAGDSGCSDSGPGNQAMPYCTITAAANQQGGPDTTILVKPGVYREKVTMPASGAPGIPFVIRALGSPVVVDGADDFSSPALWGLFSGNVWLAPSVTWDPNQVFVDGTRLPASTGPPSSLPTGAFQFVASDGLYINIGGDDPGTHETFVGRRDNNFRINARSWVTLDGFSVTRAEDVGIYLLGSCDNVNVVNNTATLANLSGIAVNQCSSVLIDSNIVSDDGNHGIYLHNGTANCTVQDNESFRNARLIGLAANGIKVEFAASSLIQRNRLHHNEDTGLQINSSDDTVSIQNLSWENGDHGYDHLASNRTTHVGDLAWKNFRDGFSVEGSNTGMRISDSISTDNGLATGRFDLFVDTTSTTGFVSDHNIFWKTVPLPPIRFGVTPYLTISAYTAVTGQDQHSIQADPKFIGPVSADFHLMDGSPAIDSADSSVPSWPAADAEGSARVDDPSTPNTGAGPVMHADRGPFEFTGCTLPPPAGSALLVLAHQTGAIRLTWSPLPGAAFYDVVRGNLLLLASSGGDFTAATGACLVDGGAATSLDDPTLPAVGTGFWYLVRGLSCGGPGTYDSGSASQIGLRDAEIAAAASTCP